MFTVNDGYKYVQKIEDAIPTAFCQTVECPIPLADTNTVDAHYRVLIQDEFFYTLVNTPTEIEERLRELRAGVHPRAYWGEVDINLISYPEEA